MITNYLYNDIVLYSKGWYTRSDDICADLGYLLSKIYGWTPKDEKEVAHMMLRVLDNLYKELGVKKDSSPSRWFHTHASFEEEVSHRMSFYEQSREKAIIYLVLAVLQGLMKDEIKLKKPVYGKKEHFRLGRMLNDYPASQTYTEMNRIASEFFDD